jgi:hypothetical protein
MTPGDVDMAYGVLWYRMLVGHAPLDDGAARDLAGHLLAAGQAGRADRAPQGNSAAN